MYIRDFQIYFGSLTSVVGQLDVSCECHCGPFHNSVDFERFVGSIPLEMRSAE